MNDNFWVSITIAGVDYSDMERGSNRYCLKMGSFQLSQLHFEHCYSRAPSKEDTIVYSNLAAANSFTFLNLQFHTNCRPSHSLCCQT